MSKTIHTALGVELGSTRIKAVLTDADYRCVAQGEYQWENRFENGVWTYSLGDAWEGLKTAIARLFGSLREPVTVDAMGLSGMMHGYLVFDKDDRLLVPFRTWRNTITGKASNILTELFLENIPQRWSVAHLCQAVLQEEAHVKDIRSLTSLAGYIHRKLTGENVVGIGEASGMFPVDFTALDYRHSALERFDALIAPQGYPWRTKEIFPEIRLAGEDAGFLSEEGARLIDPSGLLTPGIPLAPPEGDAGTGMVATNSVTPRMGNVSAGTSVFSLIVTEKPLSRVYSQIDTVATPAGKAVALVHGNNCTSDIDAWAALFQSFAKEFSLDISKGDLYSTLYSLGLEGDPDCGGLTVINYLSGEHITGFSKGCPMVVRAPESRFTLGNFMRAHLYSAIAVLKIGMDLLAAEDVAIDRLTGHGGYFKTPLPGQQCLADATGLPVSVMESAGEGGAFGMAILAWYRLHRAEGISLEDYLKYRVFADARFTTAEPTPEGTAGFETYLMRYKKALQAERVLVDS
jgi:sugar (pentulose or hexulose) kinase